MASNLVILNQAHRVAWIIGHTVDTLYEILYLTDRKVSHMTRHTVDTLHGRLYLTDRKVSHMTRHTVDTLYDILYLSISYLTACSWKSLPVSNEINKLQGMII